MGQSTILRIDRRKWPARAAIGLIVLTATLSCSGAAVNGALAQAAASGETTNFVGAWKLTRQEGRNRAGEIVPAATSDAWPGLLVYSPDGWMSVAIDRRATGGTYWGHFGKFSVAGDTIVHEILGGVPSTRGRSPALFRFGEGGSKLVISTLPNAEGAFVHFSFERVR